MPGYRMRLEHIQDCARGLSAIAIVLRQMNEAAEDGDADMPEWWGSYTRAGLYAAVDALTLQMHHHVEELLQDGQGGEG